MPQTPANHHPASVLWQWYQDMGVDEITANASTNWFEAAPPPVAKPQLRDQATVAKERAAIQMPTTPAKAPAKPNASLADTIAQARKAADSAADLANLRRICEAFDGCKLKKTAKNLVFSDGVAESDILFIGEAPGAEEDRQGIPFCGEAGQLLDKMLASIGLSRETNCYITNCVYWRPPGNQTPATEDVSICLPLVEKHIALFNPKIMVLVGGTATEALLDTNEGITRLRGKAYSYNNQYLQKDIPVRTLFHPSYLLRQPLQKRLAWKDLLELKQFLIENDIKLSP